MRSIEGIDLTPLGEAALAALIRKKIGQAVDVELFRDGLIERRRYGVAPPLEAGAYEKALASGKNLLSTARALDSEPLTGLLRRLAASADDDFAPVLAGGGRLAPNYLGASATTRWQRYEDEGDYHQIVLDLLGEKVDVKWRGEEWGRRLEAAYDAPSWTVAKGELTWTFEPTREKLLGPWITFDLMALQVEIRSPKRAYRDAIRKDPKAAEGRALEGDGRNGWVVWRDHRDRSTYSGLFKDGKAYGPGKIVKADGEIYVGVWEEDRRHGPGVVTWPQGKTVFGDNNFENITYARRRIYDHGRVTDWADVDVQVPWHAKPDVVKLFRDAKRGPEIDYAFGPWLARSGTPLSGNCQTGFGRIRFEGVGEFEGRFVNGVAEGRGRLFLKDGRMLLIDCFRGVPAVQCTLVAVDDLKFKAFASGNTFVARPGECLKGNCWDGEGVMAMAHGAVYTGSFQRNLPHGKGELVLGTHEARYTGTFKEGRKDGTFTVVPAERFVSLKPGSLEAVYQSGGPAETQWFRNDQRVTANGEEWQAAQARLAQEAREKPKPKSTDSIPPIACSACKGTGAYYAAGYWEPNVVVVPFMPGNRHYGSWLWSGYAREEGKRYVPGELVRCGSCKGIGKIDSTWR